MSLSPSDFTFAEDRLKAVWRDGNRTGSGDLDLSVLIIQVKYWGSPHPKIIRQMCLDLYDDTEISDVLPKSRCIVQFSIGRKKPYGEKAGHFEGAKVIHRAIQILRQLPATSPTILGALPSSRRVEPGYLLPTSPEDENVGSPPQAIWDKFAAVNFVDTIVLRVVLCIAQSELSRQHGPGPLEPLLNSTAHLLGTSIDIATESSGSGQRWTVVCAFLWTSWQRLAALRFRDIVAPQLRGFDHAMNHFNSVHSQTLLPEPFDYRGQIGREDLASVPYLCAWAHRTLVEDQASMLGDTRLIIQRYQGVLRDQSCHLQRRLHSMQRSQLPFMWPIRAQYCHKSINVHPNMGRRLQQTLLEQGVFPEIKSKRN
ncbi:hypothetical protein PV08_08265 [Exophiala spinifera]|uniref:Uncharacterized protein n=1 Tax=Exophiala spinifera TaxID=91928 RepID=A0A0D2B2F5_9EURO|nr:uncharacterized protein PV08_08265 [Exophiala spinifera]KIW13078.1 hypothetical protein PV08_08265 [Exophiala spinifera]